MATPNNLLEQLVMGLREPRDPMSDEPSPTQGASVEDEVLATLLAQTMQQGEGIPPANVIRPQLAADLGLDEQGLTENLMGVMNLIQMGDSQTGSLLQGFAQDRGLPTEDMRQVVRGNVALSNSDAKRQAEEADAQEAALQATGGGVRAPQPSSDDILQGLLAEARGVTKEGDPDSLAAFENKLGRMMRSSEASPEERIAAYQLRHPDMTVEMQENGVMSFSDKGPGLQIQDPETRKAVNNVRAKLETLSPDQAIVAGEGSEIAALAATTRQQISDTAVNTKARLFGPTGSKAGQDIQAQLQNVVSIQDPNERAIAFQRLGPAIAEYGRQRQSEIRNDVFSDMGIQELERSLAVQEARDRNDPRWDEFRRDSPYTASLRAQLRQARSDALVRVENAIKSDPMLNTLQSQTSMTQAVVKQLNEKDMNFQLQDYVDTMAPAQQERMRTAVQALHPGTDVTNLSSPELAKIYKNDEQFLSTVAALDSPSKTVSMIALDDTNSNRWKKYIRQAEISAGADEATADRMVRTYTNIASTAAQVVGGQMKEEEIARQGGKVRALWEQWQTEQGMLSPTEAEKRKQTYYIPRIIEAKMDYLQTELINQADREIKDLKPQTGNEKVDQLLREANEQGFALGDLLDTNKLQKLDAAGIEQGGPPIYGGSIVTTPSRRVGILQDPEARVSLARYVAARRKERMMTTAFLAPLDTFEDLNRKLGNMAVTGQSITRM